MYKYKCTECGVEYSGSERIYRNVFNKKFYDYKLEQYKKGDLYRRNEKRLREEYREYVKKLKKKRDKKPKDTRGFLDKLFKEPIHVDEDYVYIQIFEHWLLDNYEMWSSRYHHQCYSKPTRNNCRIVGLVCPECNENPIKVP